MSIEDLKKALEKADREPVGQKKGLVAAFFESGLRRRSSVPRRSLMPGRPRSCHGWTNSGVRGQGGTLLATELQAGTGGGAA